MEAVAHSENERARHYTIVAIIHIVYASLGMLFGLVAVLLLLGLSIPLSLEGPGMSELVILRVLVLIFIAVMVVATFPALIGGIGLLKKQPWARIVLLIVAVFDLVSFPIGTAIGIYTLWALWEPVGGRERVGVRSGGVWVERGTTSI